MELTAEDKGLLLRLARETITAAVTGKPRPEPPRDTSYELQTGAGAFVTIRGAEGELKGCIGTMVAHAPLVETVCEMAEKAALHDSRFSPITSDEIPSLNLEISVLSPLEEIQPDNVEVGRHGLCIRQGQRSGILLPQVATEHGLSREAFLSETCRKAELTLDAWKDPATTTYAFTACVFSEDE